MIIPRPSLNTNSFPLLLPQELEDQAAALRLQLVAAEDEQQWQAQQLAEAEEARGTALMQAGTAVQVREVLTGSLILRTYLIISICISLRS